MANPDPVAPANSVAPVVSGDTTIPALLSCTTGTWTGYPAPTYTYQWHRDGVDISGATSSTYTTTSSDDGTAITCSVTGTNAAGSATETSSNSITAVAAAAESSMSFLLPFRMETSSISTDGTYHYWGSSGNTYNTLMLPEDLTLKGLSMHTDRGDGFQSDTDTGYQIDDGTAVYPSDLQVAANWNGVTYAELDVDISADSTIEIVRTNGSNNATNWGGVALFDKQTTASRGPMVMMASSTGLSSSEQGVLFFGDTTGAVHPGFPVDLVLRKIAFHTDTLTTDTVTINIYLNCDDLGDTDPVTSVTVTAPDTDDILDVDLYIPAGTKMDIGIEDAGNTGGDCGLLLEFEQLTGDTSNDNTSFLAFSQSDYESAETLNNNCGDGTPMTRDGSITHYMNSTEDSQDFDVWVTVNGGSAQYVWQSATDGSSGDNQANLKTLETPITYSAGDVIRFEHGGGGVANEGGFHAFGLTHANDDDADVSSQMPDNSAHRYWSVLCMGSDSSYQHIAELEMRETTSGTDVTSTSFAISGDERSGFEAANAFDDTVSGNNSWGVQDSSHDPIDRWVGQDFGESNEKNIVEIAVTTRADSYYGQTPRYFALRYSDDGTNWTVKKYFSSAGAWLTSSEQRVFTV